MFAPRVVIREGDPKKDSYNLYINKDIKFYLEMTYLITTKTKDSVLMASDTRLNLNRDKDKNGEKWMEIYFIADCIQKTFYIEKAKIGIQFQGIGYLPDSDGEKYPLSHFIKKIENQKYVKNFKFNAQNIFSFLKMISEKNNVGQYVKGIMSGFFKNKFYICSFDTYNNDFKITELMDKNFIDSEENKNEFSLSEIETIKEINRRIKEKSKEKYWIIGNQVEILRIDKKSGKFIQKSNLIFNGNYSKLVSYNDSDYEKINGKFISPSREEKYKL